METKIDTLDRALVLVRSLTASHDPDCVCDLCISTAGLVVVRRETEEASRKAEKYKLTKTQRAAVERSARDPRVVCLYKSESLTGKSETLRYESRWIESTRWGAFPRSRSGMILSVTIDEIRASPSDPWRDDPESVKKYNALCDQAIELFNEIRKDLK